MRAAKAEDRRLACAVVSRDEVSHNTGTTIIAPMTTKGRLYPTRVACSFQGRAGQGVLDQVRTVDTGRLVKKLGRLSPATADRVFGVLAEMFQN